MSHAPDAPLSASAEPGALSSIGAFVYKTGVIAELEIRKLKHDPTEMITRAVQPALWLLVVGEVFARLRAIPTGGVPYLDFMAPGILAQSVLFVAIFFGIAVIWERDLGIIHKMFVSPTPRAVFVGAACFATLSLVIAALVKTRERFMGIGQVLTMPLFFASNAIYPISMMPGWLRVIAHGNPLTYLVDALRALMVQGGRSAFGLGVDVAVQLATLTVLVVVAGRLYPSVAR